MNRRPWRAFYLLVFAAFVTAPLLATQPGQDEKKEPDKKEFGKKGFAFGGPMNQRRKLVAQFDKDGDGRLNAEERKAARDFLQKERASGKGGFGPGKKGPGGF